MQILKEFKEFAIKGNAVDLAVGIVIGAAFNQVISSLVTDILNPIIGLFTGHIYFTNFKLVIFNNVLAIGNFINAVINFIIVAFAVFLIIKQINRFRRHADDVPNTQECPYCLTAIPLAATRCPACTSELNLAN